MSENEQSQAEAIAELEQKRRQAFLERMKQEQAIREEVAKKNPTPGAPPDNIDRCPHGIPLGRSCRICDVVTDDQIKDRIPLN